MTDLWQDVRSDLIRRFNEHYPDSDFETRIRVAEDIARDTKDYTKDMFGDPND